MLKIFISYDQIQNGGSVSNCGLGPYMLVVRVSKKPAARFRPGPARWAKARPKPTGPEPVSGRAGLPRRPAPLKKTTKRKSMKKNIHFKILFIECIITFENVGKVYITTK